MNTELKIIIDRIKRKELPYKNASRIINKSEILTEELTNLVKCNHSASSTEKLYCLIHNIFPEKCAYCESLKQFRNSTTGYSMTCGNKKCVSKAQHDSIRKNCLEKHGVDHHSKLDYVKSKRSNTNIEKYGAANYFGSEVGKINIKESMKKRYNVEYPTQSADIMKRIKSTQHFIKIVEWNKITPEHINVIDIGKEVRIFCDNCKNESELLSTLFYVRTYNKIEICPLCNPKFYNSGSEMQKNIFNFIKAFVPDCVQNARVLERKEIDIFIEELKIGFEFNGLFWHNELCKSNSYHLDKTLLAKTKGIQLFHIWEDDWNYKQAIVKSRILSALGKNKNKIDARKCQIVKLSVLEKKMFFNENHIQGDCISTVCLGLKYNNEIVAAMSFGNRKILKNKEIELLRFANKLNCNVRGGASKLFINYLREYDPETIISYSDNSWGSGKMYENLKFSKVKTTTPNYQYVISGIRKNRYSYRKSELVKMGHDKNLSERQIMLNEKHYRIYDCGSTLWRYSKTIIDI